MKLHCSQAIIKDVAVFSNQTDISEYGETDFPAKMTNLPQYTFNIIITYLYVKPDFFYV